MTKKKSSKKFAWTPQNKVLYRIMSSTPGVIFINWTCQGLLGMDKSELISHISFDLLLGIIICYVFSGYLVLWKAIIISLLIAHTLNWILNTHFWVMGRFIGITKTSEEEMFNYIESFKGRLESKKSLMGVVVIGNLSRGGGVSRTSDLDVSIIRQAGFINSVFANLILLKEKAAAFFMKFPLDVYLYDDVLKLGQHREDEIPILLKDHNREISSWYKDRGRETRFWSKGKIYRQNKMENK